MCRKCYGKGLRGSGLVSDQSLTSWILDKVMVQHECLLHCAIPSAIMLSASASLWELLRKLEWKILEKSFTALKRKNPTEQRSIERGVARLRHCDAGS